MTTAKLFAALLAPVTAVTGFVYFSLAWHHLEWALSPSEPIGFGPSPMPWLDIIFACLRTLFGVVLLGALVAILVGRNRWLVTCLVSLLAINAYNAYNIWFWWDYASEMQRSVFSFFHPIILADHAVQLTALLMCTFISWQHACSARANGRAA